MFNPYKVLGVPNGSDKAICKKAYRKLCIKYHPDNCSDDKNAEMFDMVNKAWKQIESGIFENVVSVKKRKVVVHNTMFSYSVV